MKRIKAPRQFANEEHRRDYDALLERYSDARMWLRAQGRIAHASVPEIPPAIALLQAPAPGHILSAPELERYVERALAPQPIFQVV